MPSDAASDYASRIVVAWTEHGPDGARGFVRWSLDGGQTFQPRHRLHGGGDADFAHVAICGYSVWATSTYQVGSETRSWADVWGLPVIDPPSPSSAGHFALGPGMVDDIGCTSSWVALGIEHAGRLDLRVLPPYCFDPCAAQQDLDLGPAFGEVGIAGTDHWIQTAWTYQDPTYHDQIRQQRIHVTTTASGLDLTAGPRQILSTRPRSETPQVAVFGSRVAVAYGDGSNVRMVVSSDHGQTFGASKVVATAPPCVSTQPCYPIALPLSIDAFGQETLVETLTHQIDGPTIITNAHGALVVPNNPVQPGPDRHVVTQVGAIYAPAGADFGAAGEFWATSDTASAHRTRLRYRAWDFPCLC